MKVQTDMVMPTGKGDSGMRRRDWLKLAAAAASSLPATASQAAKPAAITPSQVVDTHTHFYDPSRPEGVPWPPSNSSLWKTVLPADWLAVAQPLGIQHTIAVEASQWVADNRWLLDVAADNPAVLGVVGNLDPRSGDFEKNLRELAREPLFLGIRWRQELVPLDRGLADLTRRMMLLDELGLELDINVPNNAIPSVCQLANRVPKLRIVINHLGGSGSPRSLPSDWRHHIRQLAARSNVWMKVSALAEQTQSKQGEAPSDTDYYLPILDHLWESFGAKRLIFGSNWPVSDVAAPYPSIYQIVAKFFAGKGQAACDQFFWKNSQDAYRWKARGSI